MKENTPLPAQVQKRLSWPLRLTHAGMALEAFGQAFWPLWTLILAGLAGWGFGAGAWFGDDVLRGAMIVGAVLALGLLAFGLRRLRWPSRSAALDRLDATLPGAPIAALTDTLALGDDDPATRAIWRAHVARMAARVGQAAPVAPDLRLSDRDPLALRHLAVTAVVMAGLFGSLAGGIGGAPRAGASGIGQPSGPSWEGWVEPPAYTGRPTLYLNKIDAAAFEIPEGSRLTLRIYGAAGAVPVSETVSDPAHPGQMRSEGPLQAFDAEAVRTGELTIGGAGGRHWMLNVLPDLAPTVELAGPMSRKADGHMVLPFTARDDYAVTGGTATISLDLAALDRRYGLAADPEAQDALIYDLPMPINGKRTVFTQTLSEDASRHVWANMPVILTLNVTDGRGQTGDATPAHLILPGRRFFDPVASAVIEMRRDLLWSRANAVRASQVLRAMTYRPEGMIRNEKAYLLLRTAIRQLDGAQTGGLDPAERDQIAAALWEIAVLIEDGGLSDALARMQQAQQRLSEAMRNGADPAEIQKLMDDLKRATDDYIRQLAQNMEDTTDEPQRQADAQSQKITGDQIQQMMDQIQKLMEEGRMTEAQELLDQLSRMMENLRVTEGQGGDGMSGPGGKAMKDLQKTLRDQQKLSDDTFQDGQQQMGDGSPQDGSPQDGLPQDQGQNPGQGQPGDGQGQGPDQPGNTGGQDPGATGDQGNGNDAANPGADPGAGQDGVQPRGGDGGAQDGRSLAERQGDLRRALDRQKGTLPGTGDPGGAARQALEDAVRAMDGAEEALRNGDTGGAIDRQAEALDRMREGMRALNEAQAKDRGPDGAQQGTQDQANGNSDRVMPRDPLGRAPGQTGRAGSPDAMLQGEDVYRRARDLLDEIRRRAGERTRPAPELDYLGRLLDRF